MGCFLKYGAAFLIIAMIIAYIGLSSLLGLETGGRNPLTGLWPVMAAAIGLYLVGRFLMKRK